MSNDNEKSNDEKLADYAENQAWDEFYDSGSLEKYSDYVQIKEDNDEVKQEMEKEDENEL